MKRLTGIKIEKKYLTENSYGDTRKKRGGFRFMIIAMLPILHLDL